MKLTRRSFLISSAFSALYLLTGCSEGEHAAASGTLTAQKSASGLSYWFYAPQDASSSKPLILYLHGGSGKGSDLDKVLSVDGLPRYLQQSSLLPDAYVAIPQLPSSCKGWSDRASQLLALLSEVKQKYSISSIALTGHSMGGTGTWDLALAYPETFSAVAPLSGSVQMTAQNVETLRNLPTWAIVGGADTIVPPDSSIQFMQALQKTNPNAHLTVLENATHFDVPQVYLNETLDLLGWLTSQHR